MRVLLRVQDFVFSDAAVGWWRHRETLTAVLEPIDQARLLREFRYYGRRGVPTSVQRIEHRDLVVLK